MRRRTRGLSYSGADRYDSGMRNVFISYSHKDARWLRRLRVHLKPVERAGHIELWDDTKI